MPLLPGATFGPYSIVEPLGEGGMATVYRALQTSPRRYIALKVIRPQLAQSESFRRRFQLEGDVLAALEHPNILPIYAVGEEEGSLYIAYRYVGGGTLRKRFDGPLAPASVVEILTPVAAALDFAHTRGVVHRDVKPANILFTDSGTPIVADFGLAKLLAGSDAVADQLSASDASLGTPAYMAPEQVEDHLVDGRTDQYALGIVAYELLTGSVPFTGDSPWSVAIKHVREPLPAPRSRNSALSAAIEACLITALEKEPDDRYPTCLGFVSALARAAAGAEPPAKLPAPALDRALPGLDRAPAAAGGQQTGAIGVGDATAGAARGRRGRLRWVLAAAAALVLVAAGAGTALIVRGSGTHTGNARAAGTGRSGQRVADAQLPQSVHLMNGDPAAASRVPEAQDDLRLAFGQLTQRYGPAPQQPFTVRLYTDETAARAQLKAAGFSDTYANNFFSSRSRIAVATPAGGALDILAYLPTITNLRGDLGEEAATYYIHATGHPTQADTYAYWFFRGFTLYWLTQLSSSAPGFRLTAATDAHANTAPSLSSLETLSAAMAWERGQQNATERVDARAEVAVAYLNQRYGDPVIARLLREGANGSVSQFDALLQSVTGENLDTLNAALSSSLAQ